MAKGKKAFSSILQDETPVAVQPTTTAAPITPKKKAGRPTKSKSGTKLVPFFIDDDLLAPLNAEVAKRNYERGESTSSQREVINEALRLLLKIEKSAS